MDWIFNNIPVLTVFFVLYSVVQAVRRAKQQQQTHEADHDETAEQRRVREIQERIRRIAAERRDGRVSADRPAPEHAPAPLTETLRRTFEQMEPRTRPPVVVTAPPPLAPVNVAELERQQQLAEDLRVFEETKMLAQRRVAKGVATELAAARSEKGQLAASRGRLLQDLSDPQSLRRAFVLREVLGTPVGLR